MSDLERDRFVQSRLQWHISCELVEDGLIYEQRSWLHRSATRVPFESIPDDPVRETSISRFWACAVTASFVALLFALQPLARAGGDVRVMPIVLSLLAFVASALALRARSGHFIVFPCEGKRVVFLDDGGTPSLPAFLDQLQVKKTKYLSETYGPRPSEPSGDDAPDFGLFDETEDDPGGYRH
jgi:hypothetical protein